jgi:hypothetical protein
MSTSLKASDNPSPTDDRLSVAACREILSPDCPLTTSEVKELRDWMYSVANTLYDVAIKEMIE